MIMNKYLHIAARRLSLMALMMVCCLLGASAQNTLTLGEGEIEIAPGETVNIPVVLTNADDITSLQFDIRLRNNYFYFKDGDVVTRNDERIDRDTHSISFDKQSEDSRYTTYRLTILTNNQDKIQGNDGAVAYIPITATENFKSSSSVYLSNINASNKTTLVDIPAYYTARILTTYAVANVSLVQEDLTLVPGVAKTVDVNISSEVDVYGGQFDLTLPQGVSLEKKSNGNVNVVYGDIVPQNMSVKTNVLEDGKVRFILSSLSVTPLSSKEGKLFSFNIVAADELEANTEISTSNVKISTIDGDGLAYSCSLNKSNDVLKLVNSKVVAYDPAIAQVDELKAAFDAAVVQVETEAPAVKDTAVVVEKRTAVEKSITDLYAAVETAYKSETLIGNVETVLAPAADIKAAIEQYVADAIQAQKDHEAYVAEEAKKAANAAAAEALTKQVSDAKASVAAVQASVAENCKDVAAAYADQFAAIALKLDSVQADIDTKKEAVELTAESTVDTESIVKEAEALQADAVAAQKKFDDDKAAEEAKQAANAAAAEALTKQVTDAKASVAAVQASVAENCKDVVAAYAEQFAAIALKLDSVQADIDAKKEAVELTAESTVDTESIVKEAEALQADAVAAQKKFEEDAAAADAAKKANDEAYAKLTAQITDAKIEVTAIAKAVEKTCADVTADFADDFAALNAQLDSIQAVVEEKNKAIELTAEFTVDTQTIIAAANELEAAATAAQKKFEEDAAAAEAAKKANEEAYARLTAQADSLLLELTIVEKTINAACSDVALDYIRPIAQLEAKIEKAKTQVAADYAKGILTAESTLGAEALGAELAKILADAEAAQKAIDDKAANEAAYKALLPQIEAIQTAVADLKATIDAKYPELAADFADEVAELENNVDSCITSINTMYEEVKLTAEVTLDDDVKFYNEWISNILAAVEAAVIVPGDVNEDGKVDIADANAIVNYFIGNVPAQFNEKAADVNGDGKIDIADANAVVNIFLSK